MKKLAQRNQPEVLDLLQARLAFERTGTQLYDSAIMKIERNTGPHYQRILGMLDHIRNEEREHATWLAEQIRSIGGDPNGAPSEMARLEGEEAEGVKRVLIDGHEKPIHVLHALLTAELADNAGWDLLVKLADNAGDLQAKTQLMKRLAEEVKHLAFLREAVIRATQIEVLGERVQMPTDFGSVVARVAAKPLTLGVSALAVLGIGGLAAALLNGRRHRTPAH